MTLAANQKLTEWKERQMKWKGDSLDELKLFDWKDRWSKIIRDNLKIKKSETITLKTLKIMTFKLYK